MADNKKPGVVFYWDWLDWMKELTDSQIGKLTVAALKYSTDGSIPKFEDIYLRMAWSFMVPKINYDTEKYRKKCKGNKLRSDYAAYKRKRKESGLDAMEFEEWLEHVAEN